MSASLAGGVVGAVIGFFVGGPTGASWGWMAGSTLGGLAERHSAPDMTDLRPQASEHGRPIPIVYSIMALGGNIIWASDLVKTGDGDGGGKGGGGGGSGPTYAANFAVLICEGDGDIGLGRIWAGPDKRLIYDPTGGVLESGSIRFYDGAGDQLPDPLMESYLGAGNVPAYRGFAYLVLENFDVSAHDGNRIPFLTIEVGRNPVVAAGLGTVWLDRTFYDPSDQWFVSTIHGAHYGAIVNHATNMGMVYNRSGDTTSDYWRYEAGAGLLYDPTRNRLVRLLNNSNGTVGDDMQVLDLVSGSVDSTHSLGMTSAELGRGAAYDAVADRYVFAAALTASGGVRFYFVDPTTLAVTGTKDFDVGGGYLIQQNGVYGPTGQTVWATCDDGFVRAYSLTSPGSASANVGALPTGFMPGEASGAYDAVNNLLWLSKLTSGTVYYGCYSSTAALAVDGIATSFYSLASQPWLFTPDPGDGKPGVWVCGTRWLGVDHYLRFDPATGLPITGSETDGAYTGSTPLHTVIYNPSTNAIAATRLLGYYSVTAAPDLYPYHLPKSSGYLGTQDSSLSKQTLAEVVADLSQRAGLTASQIDSAALTDTVDGYVVANQVAVQEASKALMPAYFFDAVEDQGRVVFVKRGGTIVVEIPDDDLGAHPSAEDGTGDLFQTTRVMDEELPRTQSVNYLLAATKYSQATKYARRLVGSSGDEARAEFPMVFSETKAQEIADVNLHTAWVERLSFRFTLPLKYAYLMPTDLVGIGGYTMRLTKMTQKGAIFECEAVRDDADTYTPNVIVTETPPPDEVVSQQSLTLLELM